MNYIAIETSTNICSVALFKDKHLIDIIENEKKHSHSKELAVFVNKLLNSNDILINEINYIALSSGPGSFTGLRIGSSLSKGIAFSLDIPLVMVPTLHSLESSISILKKHNVCIFSHSDQIYFQTFENKKPISEIKLVSIEEMQLKKEFFFGYGLDKITLPFEYTEIKPSAKLVGNLSYSNYSDWVVKDLDKAELNYINNFNIKKS